MPANKYDDEAVFSKNFCVNHSVDQNVISHEQQYFQGMRNQFLDSLGYNQQNIILGVSSGFKLQQENDCVDSPTLTTNSERSEITEASTDFFCLQKGNNNFGGQQNLFPQHIPMQQSGYDEMQLLQQQVMLNQLQVLQRHQQLQQQDFLNPFSSVQRQTNSGQFPPLIDGTPLGDASQGYINWPQRITSPAQHGTFHRSLFPVGLGSNQLDASLYGTPVANMRGNMGQQSPMQVMYQDSGNLAAKTVGQTQKSVTQLSDFSNPFLKDHYSFSPAQVSLREGAFMSNLGFQGKGMPEADPVGNLSGNSRQINTSSNVSSGKQEQLSWSSIQQKDTKPSQGLVPLDPLEEKILFNMEDSSISDIAAGVFGDNYDNVNFSNSIPSIQSGSWSALMQSAVAEASSSDAGVQEEFSGLTYQNMELSADNNMSKLIDSDKQQADWVNDSLPGTALFSSKSLEVANNHHVSSTFPGFQLLSDQQRVGSGQGGGTPDSTQKSPKVTGLWVDCNPQHKLGNRQVQFDGSSVGKMYSTEMLDQVHSQIGNPANSKDDLSTSNLCGMQNSFQLLTSSLDPSQGGKKWENATGSFGRAGLFHNLIQQNNPATVSESGALSEIKESQIQMVNPPVASQCGDASQMSNKSVTRQFNVWMDLPTRQHPLDQESSKVPVNTKSSAELLGGNVLSYQKVHVPYGACNVPQRVGLPQVQVPSTEHVSGSSVANKDFPSVQGWKPGEPGTQNYASFNNLQVANNTDADASKIGVNSEAGPNILRGAGIFGQKLYEENSGLEVSMNGGIKPMVQLNPSAFEDKKMNLMVEAKKSQSEQNLTQNLLSDVGSSGMVALAQCNSQSQSSGDNLVASSMEHGNINVPVSTPIWFKQMGALKNGELQSVYDSKNIPSGHLPSVKDADVVPCTEQVHDAQDARYSDTKNENMAILVSKKRKFMTPTWHEEVTHVSQRLQTISEAGEEWAHVTNRLFEKGEYEIGKIEYIQSFSRSKRRLVLTAQLMQQLFRPAPAFTLMSDVSSSYHSLLYFLARANLRDACSLTHMEENSLPLSSNDVNKSSGKIESHEKRRNWQYSKVAKELTEKVKKLEDDFDRLEKAASMADINFEIEDLERFSVINRFARFHSRPQVEYSVNPSLPTLPKPIPQRYVAAVLSPRNLPEGVHCLPL